VEDHISYTYILLLLLIMTQTSLWFKTSSCKVD